MKIANVNANRLRDTKLPRLDVERQLMRIAVDRLLETVRIAKALERGLPLQ